MVVELIGQILLEVVFAGTGHLVLWALTLGRWRPGERREELATLAGGLAWVAIVLTLCLLYR